MSSMVEALLEREEASYTRKVLSTSICPSDAKGKRPLQEDALYFIDDDMKDVVKHHEDPLVIEVDIRQYNRVTKIMVDTRSSWTFYILVSTKEWGGDGRSDPTKRAHLRFHQHGYSSCRDNQPQVVHRF